LTPLPQTTDSYTLPELLSPAGNLEKLRIAIAYGADAVYAGGPSWGLRARAGNFTLQELEQGLQEAHAAGCQVYLTLNSFLESADWGPLKEHITYLNHLNPDALIVSDPALVQLLKRETDIPLHISTQTSCANSAAMDFWEELGASRVVLARELSLKDLHSLRAESGMELELFVQGAMCSSWSGKCTISNYLSGGDANRGGCTHPCRWDYEIPSSGKGQFLFSRELNMLTGLPELLETGVNSLKIEGRMRSLHYVATMTRIYRQALDHIRQRRQQNAEPEPELLMELSGEVAALGNREYTSGSYHQRAGRESISRRGATEKPQLRYIGRRVAGEPDNSWFAITSPFDPVTTREQLEVVSRAAIEGVSNDRSGAASGSAAQTIILTDRGSLSGPLGERLQQLHPNSIVRLTGIFDSSAILQARKITVPEMGPSQ